jgi:hypothetical protein
MPDAGQGRRLRVYVVRSNPGAIIEELFGKAAAGQLIRVPAIVREWFGVSLIGGQKVKNWRRRPAPLSGTSRKIQVGRN